jgi:dTDP-L-rhamnose 4-epimerase
MVVASSRAVYGEGRYRCPDHGIQFPGARLKDDMRRGEFEPKCATCGANMEAVATTEDSALHPTSFYGLTKLAQEQMTLMFGRTLGLRAFALRYQNVYGPGQSLNNPYTGILAVFSTQAREGKPIYVFEDGRESRDFVYVEDVVEATVGCLQAARTQQVLNVGSGERVTVLEVANGIVAYFGSRSAVSVNGAFREGDIRHNFADLTQLKYCLGLEPKWKFGDGLRSFLDWSAGQEPGGSRYEDSLREMQDRGLYHAG